MHFSVPFVGSIWTDVQDEVVAPKEDLSRVIAAAILAMIFQVASLGALIELL